jgi:hypothetical protein
VHLVGFIIRTVNICLTDRDNTQLLWYPIILRSELAKLQIVLHSGSYGAVRAASRSSSSQSNYSQTFTAVCRQQKNATRIASAASSFSGAASPSIQVPASRGDNSYE